MRTAIRFLALIALIAAPSFATDAAAGTICPTDIGNEPPIWDNVTPNTGADGCELGSTNNDSETQVNADAMFDITDWALLTGADVNLTSGTLCADPSSDPTNCDNTTGWVYPSDAESIMLVLKGGAGDNTEPPVYVGYLLDGLPSIIDFITPFLNVQGETGQQVSHFNLYWSEEGDNTVTEVPEPATMLLVGGGLAAALRRRRSKR
jgi:hypothetical protein